MTFEWDEAKSAKLKAERGVSLEEVAEAIERGMLIAETANPHHPGQKLMGIRMAGAVWVAATEQRGQRIRLTVWPSRKWRKKYGP